jgi:hypothetical protein
VPVVSAPFLGKRRDRRPGGESKAAMHVEGSY